MNGIRLPGLSALCIWLLLAALPHVSALAQQGRPLPNHALALAQRWLDDTRYGEPASTAQQALAILPEDSLVAHLATPAVAKAFWLNVYNAAVLDLLMEDTSRYADKTTFFAEPYLTIAGHRLSLDDVEHGILRRARAKWSLGYLRKWFVPRFIRQMMLPEIDYRIHFALNCGAASCPPILHYDAQHLERQLDLAARGYLKQTVAWDSNKQAVALPRLCLWFRSDFGGSKGIRNMLSAYDAWPPEVPKQERKEAKWTYLPYDWRVSLPPPTNAPR